MKNQWTICLIAFLIAALVSACAPTGAGHEGTTPVQTGGNADMGQSNGGAIGNDSTASTDSLLTQQQAKEIALEHVQLTEDQVSGLRVHYDYDDGVPEYDVEFHCDGTEYEFEIHAQTGKILSFEKEPSDLVRIK